MPEVGNAMNMLATFRSCLILDEHCEVNGFVGDGLEYRALVVCAGGGNCGVGAIVSKELRVGVGWLWERSGIEARAWLVDRNGVAAVCAVPHVGVSMSRIRIARFVVGKVFHN